MKRLLLVLMLLCALTLPAYAQDNEGDGDTTADTSEVIAMPAVAGKVAALSFGAFSRDAIPVEMQAWWQPAYGHVHTGILIPIGKQVSGVLALSVRIVMHDNPGKLHRFSITDERPKDLVVKKMGDLTCAGVCAWGFDVQLDTRLMKDGWRELRVKSYIDTPDGKQMISSSGIPVLVRNGGASSDFRHDCNGTQLIGRGWYTSFDYTNAIIDCVPIAPVNGTLVLRARAQQPSAHLTVDLDKSHYIPAAGAWPEMLDSAGVNLFDRDGNFQKWIAFSIDTTKLANGWHSFQVKSTKGSGAVSKCGGCPNVMSFPSGIAKAWFYVQN